MLSVILVEDSAVVRERLVDLLHRDAAFEIVGEYEDAQDAIDGIRKVNPNVVLLDIKLRKSSGTQVLQFVKEHAPNVKVIVLSNYAEPQYRARYLADGAFEVLDKSNEFDRVSAILHLFDKHQPL